MPMIGTVNVVKTEDEARNLYRQVKSLDRPVAVDTEFGVNDKGRLYITVWSLSWAKGIRNCLYAKPSLPIFKPWLESFQAPKVLYNYSADAESFYDCGIKLNGLHADAMVMDALVDTSDPVHNLKHAVGRYLGLSRRGFLETFSYVPEGKKKPVPYTWAEILGTKVLRRILYEYSANDAEDLIRLYYKHKATLNDASWKYWPTYLKEDRPFTLTLHRIMQRGFPISVPFLSELEKRLHVTLLRKAHIIRCIVEEPELNLDSPQQLQKLFFEKLEFPAIKKTKGARKKAADDEKPFYSQFSVDKEVLHSWADVGLEVARKLLDYREISTIKKTFATGILTGVDKSGRLYSDLNQIGAQSGRISSRKYAKTIMVSKRIRGGEIISVPKVVKVGANLQNIPVRSDLGKEIRRAFIAGEGYKLVVADYSGAEWWLMAHFSEDSNMLKQSKMNWDPHSFTAKGLFDLECPVEEVKEKHERYRFYGKCFHPDTEVLTKRGWIRIVDLRKGEEVIQAIPEKGGAIKLEWVVPLEVFTKRHYMKKLVHLKNEGIDLKVTPDHRMLVYRANGKHAVVFPEDFPKARYWTNAGMLEDGKSVDRTNLKLAVAMQADGSLTPEGHVRFGFTKIRKVKRLKRLLNTALVKYTYTKRKSGAHHFYINRDSAEGFMSLLNRKKVFPKWWIFKLDHAAREIVLEECQFWDGGKQSRWTMHAYYSNVKQNVDVMQALASLTGRKTRLVWKDGCWMLSIKKSNRTRGENVQAKTFTYTDKVACLSVPSSFVLVRDKGIPVVTGQTANFGLIYGCGDEKAAQLFQMKVKKAARIKRKFFRDLYPGITDYHRRMVKQAKLYGYVTTIAGRRRHIPEIHSSDELMVGHAERVAINSPVQGSVADIIKRAMNVLERDKFIRKLGGQLLLQVHDELVWRVPEDKAEKLKAYVIPIMQDSYANVLKVKLRVDAGVGRSWAEAK